jgi:hypothetical protein
MLAFPSYQSLVQTNAGTEYGIVENEIRNVAANLYTKAKRAVKNGKARSFDGDIEKAIGD